MHAVTALIHADRQSGVLPTVPPTRNDGGEATPPESDADIVPERLGNYRLVTVLGQGGMGIVYLGERADGLFDQRVAVKLIRRQLGTRGAAAFDAERRLLARMEHPNIARLIDGGVAADGRPWLAIEHVAGVAIDAAGLGRPLAQRVGLFLQAARATRFAHGQLVAHGDIKPANILVTGDDQAKLLDFGVARLIGAAGPEAVRSYTPGFASPERVAGAPPSVLDDVFALGRTLAAIVGDSADIELTAMVACATASEARRYASVELLIKDLENWLERRPVVAMGGGSAYRARKFVQRHRFGVIASLLAIVGLIGAGIVAETNRRQAERARTVEALRFADAHRTAHYLMFTLLDRLEHRPGTLRLRTQVAAVAQRYLDRLAASPGATRDVRLDVAKGYLQATVTAGMSNSPNLGDVNLAMHDLASAQAMLARLRQEEPHWQALADPVGRAASLECQNQLYGAHDARQAVETGRHGVATVDSILDDPAARRIANWSTRICIGDALVWLNRSDRAIRIHPAKAAARSAVFHELDAAVVE
ncbi:serine/threonine-protein kinase, partial [Sphingomonas bacterium]|uniref:serine/threonine-protein kinase n=1 Tax=Sphingomonas bacterium TaxID=1895847 RepID=UPI0015760DCE